MTPKLVPAAQYLRMSTDDQPNSIPCQRDVIGRYAGAHGFEIVATYTDEGKSGLYIDNRPGLRNLLRDVLSGHCKFRAVLVYDVSRWGRFQDMDESAHYEFLCRRAGIPVQYCAEQFENDGRIQNAILKSLKRIMAAEFSREMGVKIAAVKKRLAIYGFHGGGCAVYGLRRLLICENGQRQILANGEHKALRSDHVILTPGPKREVDCVRLIFALAAKKKNSPHLIAQELNRRNMVYLGNRPWDHQSVYKVLRTEAYTGSSVYGKTRCPVRNRPEKVTRENWIIKKRAFPAIITPKQFALAQMQIARRKCNPKTDQHYLDQLTAFLARSQGAIPSSLTRQRRILSNMCNRRFGSVMNAYKLIGYSPCSHVINSVDARRKLSILREALFKELKTLFGSRIRMFHHSGGRRFRVLEIDNRWRMGVYICRNAKSYPKGAQHWNIKILPRYRSLPTLLCLPNKSLTNLDRFFFVPDLGPTNSKTMLQIGETHEWLSFEKRLHSLKDLWDVVATAMEGRSQSPPNEVSIVGDVVFTEDDPTFSIDGNEIKMSRETAHVFRTLLKNAGRVVTRSTLSKSRKKDKEIYLGRHIFYLRKSLGQKFRNRIITSRKNGYIYDKNEQLPI